jgi:hypothetical protein
VDRCDLSSRTAARVLPRHLYSQKSSSNTAYRRATYDIESPIIEFTLNRRTPDLQSHQFRTGVFKINSVALEISSDPRMALEHQIMIPGNDNLLAMVLFAEPSIEIDNFLRRIAERHEMAGVNQHVPIRHTHFGVLAMCIANAHYADSRHRVARRRYAFILRLP